MRRCVSTTTNALRRTKGIKPWCLELTIDMFCFNCNAGEIVLRMKKPRADSAASACKRSAHQSKIGVLALQRLGNAAGCHL